MAGESGVTGRIIEEPHSSDIEGDEIEGESGVTRSIIVELHSSDIQRDQMKLNVVLLDLSLMNLIIRKSNKIR